MRFVSFRLLSLYADPNPLLIAALSLLEMNGGVNSRLPARTLTARPASFHSLSEHNRNNPPALLSPYSQRKARPPRSSPLAGPSVSSEQLDGGEKDGETTPKPRYRPNRISSTPDMAPPLQPLYDSDGSSLQFPPVPHSSSSSSSSGEDEKEGASSGGKDGAEDGSRFRRFGKRLSFVSTSSSLTNQTDKHDSDANKRHSSFIPQSTSSTSLASTSSSRTARTDKTSQTAPPIPTIPRWALNAMREEAGIANRNAKYGHRRGASDDRTNSSPFPPLPNQPLPRGTSGLSNQPRPPSMSPDPTENWMSMTDPIPKFSRLGLRGDGVVLPMKKKESLAKMKSSSSIKATRSTATTSQSTCAKRDGGTTTRAGPSLERDSNDSNATITESSPKEDGQRKRRHSLAGSLKARIPKITVSSLTPTENVPATPSLINQSGSVPASVSNSRSPPRTSNDPAPGTPEIPIPEPPPILITPPGFERGRRDSVLVAIDENQQPSSPPNDTEIGTRVSDVKPKDGQKKKMRRKSVKQIVMRITTAPLSGGEKLRFGTTHNAPSTPVVVPLDPPPAMWFGKPATSSVQSLPSTRVAPEPVSSQFDAGGSKKFKGIRRRWNAVLATVRR